jgi:molybdate transport system substrate-binding protein
MDDVNMLKASWASDWKVGIRVWFQRSGHTVLGQGRAELLAAIEQHGSITKAAKAVGISYRKAWSLVQQANQAAGEPLVEAAVGGIKGGGTQLTPHGRFALEVYQQVHRTLYEAAAGALQRIVNHDADAMPCIHLAAAISLQEVLGQLLAEYALQKPTVRVRAIFGASNELTDQVLAGAPCDLLISAEFSQIDRLETAKLLVPRSRHNVASNGLAVISRPKSKQLNKIADLLTTRVKRVALAEPACPLGRYSQAYLQLAGIYEALLPKILHVDNSRAVPSAVISGAADVGLAFSSDATQSNKYQTLFRVPQSQAAAQYVAAVIKTGQQTDEAKALLKFLTSADAARCFKRCGFRPAQH